MNSTRATLQLPRDVRDRLRLAAATIGRPMGSIAAEAITREIERLARQRPQHDREQTS